MEYFLLILLMAVLSRMAGGGLGGHWLANRTIKIYKKTVNFKWLPEVLFALPFGYCGYFINPWLTLPAIVWSYLWMQSGHGNVLHWGNQKAYDSMLEMKYYIRERKQTLNPLVDHMAKQLRIKLKGEEELYTLNYCRLFMAVKGFLIGLPAGGLPLAILWPLAYEIGQRNDKPQWSELLAGAFTGLVIIAAIFNQEV